MVARCNDIIGGNKRVNTSIIYNSFSVLEDLQYSNRITNTCTIVQLGSIDIVCCNKITKQRWNKLQVLWISNDRL
jgi:hypothetical protein